MLSAYINYPEPHSTIHFDLDCSEIEKRNKPYPREIKITVDNLSEELSKFGKKLYKFGTNSKVNDVWLFIDFQDRDFEVAVLNHIIKLIGQFYRPFKEITPTIHC